MPHFQRGGLSAISTFYAAKQSSWNLHRSQDYALGTLTTQGTDEIRRLFHDASGICQDRLKHHCKVPR